MATSHICRGRPGFTEGDDPWTEGTVNSCPYHGQRVVNQTGVRWGKAARAKMDRETGVVGIDRGGHISG